MSVPPRRPAGFRGRVLADELSRAAYSEGAGPFRVVPAAVAIPQDQHDLSRIVQGSAEAGVPLVPRGAGSGMAGGNVGPGIVVDLQGLDATIRFLDDDLLLAGAAATRDAVAAAAAQRGLSLPPDPSSGAFCTLGGMVATNAAGPASLRQGSIRPWALGIEVVTADGEAGWLLRHGAPRPDSDGSPVADELTAIRRFTATAAADVIGAAALVAQQFPRPAKNSAGYALDHYLRTGDLVDLLVGSEGTLAFVTRVLLRLERAPAAAGGALLAVNDLEALGEVIMGLRTLDPTAIELLDRTLLALGSDAVPEPLREADAALLVRFEGEADAVADASRSVADAAPAAKLVRIAHGAARLEALWRVRHAASPTLARLPEQRRSLQIVEDGCVPPESLGRYALEVRRAARDAGIEIAAFGHAGDGHLHVNALVDTSRPGFEDALEELYLEVSRLVLELRGTPSGEHGDGRLRAPLVEQLFGVELARVFRRVKEAFDPQGILNPGTILAEPSQRPLEHLKVGRGAAPIPAAVAARLREMERAAGWGRRKLELAREAAPEEGVVTR